MALDFAPQNIHINAVAPGYIGPPLLRGFAEATGDIEGATQQWCRRIPIRRLQQSAEVVEMILFLTSSRASAVAGVTYPVDGVILTAQPSIGD